MGRTHPPYFPSLCTPSPDDPPGVSEVGLAAKVGWWSTVFPGNPAWGVWPLYEKKCWLDKVSWSPLTFVDNHGRRWDQGAKRLGKGCGPVARWLLGQLLGRLPTPPPQPSRGEWGCPQ